MIEFRIPLARLCTAAVLAVCFVIAVFAVNLQSPGRRRSLALVGVVSLGLSAFGGTINGSLAAVYGPASAVYAVGSVVVGVLAAVGLVLLAWALAAAPGSRRPRGDR